MAAGVSERGESTSAQDVYDKPFRRLLVSWAMTSVGDGVRAAALPLYTAVSTRDPLAVSAVAVAEVLPWLLVALPAGALVDRWSCRRTLVRAHLFRCVVTLVLATSIHTGTAALPVLMVCAFLLSSAETFADSASQTMLVTLSGPNGLERANGRFVGVETVGIEIAGPLAAAALFAWQPASCFALNALAFGVGALWAVAIPMTRDPVSERGRAALGAEVRAGVGFLLRNPSLRIVVGVVGLVALLTSAVNAVAILFAVDVLQLPPATVPTLLVCTAIGTILATRVVPWSVDRFGGGHVMIVSLLVLATGIAVLGTVRVPAAVWFAYFVMGFGAGTWNVLSAANRQRLTPAPMIGRVTSAYRVLAWGLMPLGAAAAGPIAEASSLDTVILGAAALIAVIALVAAPALRRL